MVSTPLGQIVFNRTIVTAGLPADAAVTRGGNLKLLVRIPSPTEATTADAALIAACPGGGFDFAAQNQAAAGGPANGFGPIDPYPRTLEASVTTVELARTRRRSSQEV